MLIVRLQRTGKKNQSDFRIVLTEKSAAASKKFIEVLGRYNPRKKLFQVKNSERLNYWVAKRVLFSPTVYNLLVSNKLLEGSKVHAFSIPKKAAEPVKEIKPAGVAPVDVHIPAVELAPAVVEPTTAQATTSVKVE